MDVTDKQPSEDLQMLQIHEILQMHVSVMEHLWDFMTLQQLQIFVRLLVNDIRFPEMSWGMLAKTPLLLSLLSRKCFKQHNNNSLLFAQSISMNDDAGQEASLWPPLHRRL